MFFRNWSQWPNQFLHVLGKNTCPKLTRDRAWVEFIDGGQFSSHELAFGVELIPNLYSKNMWPGRAPAARFDSEMWFLWFRSYSNNSRCDSVLIPIHLAICVNCQGNHIESRFESYNLCDSDNLLLDSFHSCTTSCPKVTCEYQTHIH